MRAMHYSQEAVFHDGERRMHEKLGISERMHELGLRMIRDHMPDQHREFFSSLSSIHLGVIDADGYPCAIQRIGEPGFIDSPDARTLTIESTSLSGEPETLDFSLGAKISVLGLEMETRRRNRANATILDNSNGLLTLHIDQSYGNCPKYIQMRSRSEGGPKLSSAIQTSELLSPRDQALIVEADTLIIASRAPDLNDDPRAGVDINHRGGNPGFVKVLDAETIEFPDYKGNSFYNSFGNILLDQRVSLQFQDFETGTLLTVKGTAELIEHGEMQLPLMGRSLRVHIHTITRAEGASHLRYTLCEYSPKNPTV